MRFLKLSIEIDSRLNCPLSHIASEYSMATIYLVRHGQASAGTDNYDRLSERGRHQAKLLGESWLRRGFAPAAAFAGSLERQQDTASIALKNANLDLPVSTIIELNEYDHTIVDGLFGNGLASDMPENFQFSDYQGIMGRWHDASEDQLKGYEAWQEFETRGWEAIKKALSGLDSEASAVFFTSGGIVATVLSQCLQLDFEKTLDVIWHIYNGSVTTIKLDQQRVAVLDYNTRSHLERDGDSSLLTHI